MATETAACPMPDVKILAEITAIIASILLNDYEITAASQLIGDLKMDSVYMIEFVIALEGQYQFKITPAQIAKLSSVGDVVALIMAVTSAR